MPTVAATLGKTLDLLLKAETAYGTPPSGNYLRTLAYTWSLRASRAMEDDPILGAARHNDRDATAPAPGLTEHAGSVEVPLDFNHIGWWLSLLMGQPVTTGSGPYTHVFSSGKGVLPSWTVEEQIGSEFVQHRGVVARNARFELGQAGGYRRLSIDLGGKQEQEIGSTGAGTPVAALARAPFAAAAGSLAIDGVEVGDVLAAMLTYDLAMEAERYISGDDTISGWGPGDADASANGEVRVRWKDGTYSDMALAGAAHTLELRYWQSATQRLTLALADARFARSGPNISGPGRLEQTVPFRAGQTASAPMLTATLTNATASYAGAY